MRYTSLSILRGSIIHSPISLAAKTALKSAVLLSMAAIFSLPATATALTLVEARFAGSDAGEWSQGGTVVGADDVNCRNRAANYVGDIESYLQ